MASRSLGTLTVDLVAQIGGFIAGMTKAQREAEERSKKIESTIKGAVHGIEAAFAAFGVEKFVHKVIEATIEHEDALRQLETRLVSTGRSATVSAKEVEEFATQMSHATRFTRDAVIGVETLLLSFKSIKDDELQQATVATLNLAAALKTDLPEAAKRMGLALNGGARGVQRLQAAGVSFTGDQAKLVKLLNETGRTAEAHKIIFQAVADAYGGAAAAGREGLGGALDALKKSFDELFIASDTTDVQKSVNDLVDLLKDPETVAAAGTLANAIVTAFAAAAKAIRGTVSAVQTITEDFAKLYFNWTSNTPVSQLLMNPQHGATGEWSTPGATGSWKPNPALAGGKSKPGHATDISLAELEAEMKAEKDAVAAQKKLQEAFESQLATLQEHGALVGKVTQLEKTRYDVTLGALKDILPAEKEMLLIAASQATAADVAAEAEKKHQDQMAEGLKITEELRTPYEAYIAQVTKLNDLLGLQAIDLETYRRGVVDAATAMDEATKKTDKWSAFIDEAHRNLQDILSSTLTDAFEGQKTNILKSFADMLLKMAAQAASAKILDAVFTSVGNAQTNSGGFGGILKSIFGGFFTQQGAGAGAAGSSFLASGGPTLAGKTYTVGEHGPEKWVAPADGYVIPNGATSAAGGGVQVNVINPPAQPQVTESKGANGQRQIQIMFDKMLQSSMSEGRFDGTMRNRFGLRPAPGGAR